MDLVRWGALAVGVGIVAMARPLWTYLATMWPLAGPATFTEADDVLYRLAGFLLVGVGLLMLLYGAVI